MRTYQVSIAFLAVVLMAFFGCKSKDTPSQESGGPAERTPETRSKQVADGVGQEATTDSNTNNSMNRFVVVHDVKVQHAVAKMAADSKLAIKEQFNAGEQGYSVIEAPSSEKIATALSTAGIAAEKVTAVRDINSPTRGGGEEASPAPREGHATFVIERSIPGVGGFPDEKKKKISTKSNSATAEVGTDKIEWVHSYLTDEGTYCVYRATDEEKIRDHAKITGAPITKIVQAEKVPQAL